MNLKNIRQIRQQLLNLYNAALTVVDARLAVVSALNTKPILTSRIWCVAVGKAALRMMQGADAVLSSHLERGLVITKEGHAVGWHECPAHIDIMTAGHPTPDERSLLTGAALLHFIQSAPDDVAVLFLVSGGASALVEVLPDGVSLDDLQRINHWMLANGLTIHEINTIRKSLSRIKGGRLAQYLCRHPVRQLILSDVPGDVLQDIGSGLLVPTLHQTMPTSLPDWLVSKQQHNIDMPTPDDPIFTHIDTAIIANNAMAVHAVITEAKKWGLIVRHQSELQGDALSMGKVIAQSVLDGEPGVYVWGGETVMTLPSTPGRGGRCQSLALAAAMVMAGHDDIAILAGSTDGTDGPTDIAGAVVDGQTCQRGELEGLSAATSLANADAGSFLEASGDVIDTGPTGTNVMDVVIAIKQRQ